jgi:hypothetical protein
MSLRAHACLLLLSAAFCEAQKGTDDEELEKAVVEGHFWIGDGLVHKGAFAVLVVYVLITAGLAVYAFFANRATADQTGDEQSAYFLAGRSFGPVVLFLTLFSTIFSGFTVVFIPLEVAWKGLGISGRFVSFLGAASANFYITAPFRVIGTDRKHTTLSEFYMDRYRSNSLTFVRGAANSGGTEGPSPPSLNDALGFRSTSN